MTKAEIVSNISDKSGIEKADVLATVEAFMEEVKNSLEKGDNVYLRGFGSFIIKTRAEKTGRNISKNTTIKIPAHNIPSFKPAKVFVEGVKSKVTVSISKNNLLTKNNILLCQVVKKERDQKSLRINVKKEQEQIDIKRKSKLSLLFSLRIKVH